ncbi:MAG: Do family serine endopeptidase [Granulosicoccus sp.]
MNFKATMLGVLLIGLGGVSTVAVAGALPAFVDGHAVPSLAPMLDKVTPAVVNISTLGPTPQRNPLMDDPFFRRFFDFPETNTNPRPQSLGSGVVIDAENGYIVTNNHVIENASKILVTLADGREAVATTVGTDPEADVALIKIDLSDLTALEWADSSALRVGDFCVAIGNPFGLGQTVTSGIVSALGRSGLGIEAFEDFIQTDASINPGNSGGALVGLTGELIGINTAIVGPSGGNVGIGFAIPANMAVSIIDQLIEYGEVKRGALGIAAQELTPKLAEAFGVQARYGVIISRIREGSSADKAGLQVGDVITAIDGRPVRDIKAVKNRIGLVRLGQRMQLSVLRDNVAVDIDAVVEQLVYMNPLLEGVEFESHTSSSGAKYIVVSSVSQGSSFDQYGLEAGDIVLSVNQRAISTVDELEQLAETNQQEILLLIQRGRRTQYVRIR